MAKKNGNSIGPILLSDLKQLAQSKPRETAVLAELVRKMLGANEEDRQGNYLFYTFISTADKDVVCNVANSLDELLDYWGDWGHSAAPIIPPRGIVHVLRTELANLDMALHDRFMDHDRDEGGVQ